MASGETSLSRVRIFDVGRDKLTCCARKQAGKQGSKLYGREREILLAQGDCDPDETRQLQWTWEGDVVTAAAAQRH